MDRLRPRVDRQKSMDSPTGSPVAMSSSPLHRHARSSSSGFSVRKQQNVAAKAAAQRLAQVMSQGGDDDDEDEDDLLVDYNPTGSLGLASGRSARPRSRSPSKVIRPAATDQPVSMRTPVSSRTSFSGMANKQQSSRPTSSTRLSPSPIKTHEETQSTDSSEVEILETRSALSTRPSLSVRTDGPSSARSNQALRSSLSVAPSEQPPSARSGRSPMSVNSSDVNLTGRSPMPSSSAEQPPSARSSALGRPSGMKTLPMVPPAVTISLKQQIPSSPAAGARSSKRMSLDMGSMRIRESKEPSSQLNSTALQDELDMLQEENDDLLDKLRMAEERLQETEARAKQLERQVANLGEGVSMEARLLNRKEAVLQQREAALRVASQTHGGTMGEIATLRMETEAAREEANSALDQLHESESELRSLRLMVQRLMLTQEEMEEVVLKRCWLARYWGLCVRHGIYPDIAEVKHEYWSSFAPLPVEIVIEAGHKAKEDIQSENDDQDRAEKDRDASELSGEGSAESMLIVEKGLREMAVLKVEDAVRLAMAHQRRKTALKPAFTDDLRSPSQKYVEAFELSQDEVEDVQFKQAWLLYFWRRARNHDVEPDIAEERLRYWISHSARATTSHDAVDVERGLMELRKLGLETQLWEETRRWTEHDTHIKRQTDF
ncbi:hypothetical protein RND81_04G019000 [Saponaria officinalis]|uniref:Coiled-coil domain-containing protein SCD2 n=1 Tax=Saponaria officinalis TaxID=3572 RepID=A0AAW1LEB4_SAPOF